MDYQLLFHEYKHSHSSRKQPQQRLLYQCLREAILAGKLKAGEPLLGSRALAAELQLSRNSVLYAYEQLATEGLLDTAGRKTRVSANALIGTAEASPRDHEKSLSLVSRAQLQIHPPEPTVTFAAFMPGVPALSEFPITNWRRCLERAWRSATANQLDYGDAAGEPALRAAIAEHLTTTRGVICNSGQVFITNGTQHSLDLCAFALANAGDTVWVENPGYEGAAQAFRAAELNLQGIAVDENGMAPSDEDWQNSKPKLIYTTPAHQFPLGQVLSIERRMSLIENAKIHGSWIIEDDYDSEFRRDGPPLPAMQGLSDNTPVIYLGTFSKTLFPALRIGFMVVPNALTTAFTQMMKLHHLGGRTIDQLALAEFLRTGQFSLHLRKMRRLYAARRDALVAAIQTHLGHIATLYGGSSGIHLTIELPKHLPDIDISTAALEQGIYVKPLSKLATGTQRCNGLMLGYARVPAEQMDELIARLATVINHGAMNV